MIIINYFYLVHLPVDFSLLYGIGLFFDRELDTKERRCGVNLMQCFDFFENFRQLFIGVYSKTQDVTTCVSSRSFDHECMAKLGIPDLNGFDLQVWNGNVKVFRQVSMPNQPHVGHKECSEVSLIRTQIPNSVDFVINVFIWKHDELFILDNCTAQLEIAVQFGGLVRAVHSLHCSKKTRAVLVQVSEDKLKATVVKLGHHVETLSAASKLGLGSLDSNGKNTIETDTEVCGRILRLAPDQPKVCHRQHPLFSIVAFCIFYLVDRINFLFTSASLKFSPLNIETNFSILPHISNLLLRCTHQASIK
mmetsp:Transcript_20284/g.28508  ORF Transcript_20284/g.28508 Transcript_20284/m.28508 type:complete len:306 (+) Transcript_20284:474-1391(+)